jgi:hypothetical protein
VRARRGAFAQAEQAVGELFSVIGQNGADADRAGALQVTQEPPGIRCSLCLEDADEDPAGGAVDGDKQVAPRVRRENSPPDCF